MIRHFGAHPVIMLVMRAFAFFKGLMDGLCPLTGETCPFGFSRRDIHIEKGARGQAVFIDPFGDFGREFGG